jgi:predicted dehydrogenase
MEGFMYRCHPQWGLARAILDEGSIGAVRSLRAAFCYDMGERPGSIRLSRAAGGGALADVGCYALDFARRFAGGEPIGMRVTARIGPEGVDDFAEARLEFPGGVKADLVCGLREARPHLAVIEGELGRIEIPRPWHPPADGAEVKVTTADGEICYRTGDGLGLFAREALEVAENLGRGQGPSMPWEDTLAQARALERMRIEAGVG